MEKQKKVSKKDVSEIVAPKAEVKADDYTIKIVEDFDGKVDPFTLSNKDPKYAYRFLRAEDKNLSTKTGNLLYQKGGWQICQKEHLKKIGLKDEFITKNDKLSPDGLCRRGDTVLAFMPKELFEKKQAYKRKLANEKTDAVQRLISKGDPSVSGIGHSNMKGLQTKEALKM